MYFKKAVTLIIKASTMSLLLCCSFYPLSAQISIKEVTEPDLKDSSLFYHIEKENAENSPIVYINEGTGIHNLEKFSNVGKIVLYKTLKKDSTSFPLAETLGEKITAPKVRKDKPQLEKSVSQAKVYFIHCKSSFFKHSEYSGREIAFTTTAVFHIKHGILAEKYKDSIMIRKDIPIYPYSGLESVLKIFFFNTKIRPPPFLKNKT